MDSPLYYYQYQRAPAPVDFRQNESKSESYLLLTTYFLYHRQNGENSSQWSPDSILVKYNTSYVQHTIENAMKYQRVTYTYVHVHTFSLSSCIFNFICIQYSWYWYIIDMIIFYSLCNIIPDLLCLCSYLKPPFGNMLNIHTDTYYTYFLFSWLLDYRKMHSRSAFLFANIAMCWCW
jgi:hypothetical protein